jgi:hypothetical protein
MLFVSFLVAEGSSRPGSVCVWGESRRELVSFATPLALGGVAVENSTVKGLINDLQ